MDWGSKMIDFEIARQIARNFLREMDNDPEVPLSFVENRPSNETLDGASFFIP